MDKSHIPGVVGPTFPYCKWPFDGLYMGVVITLPETNSEFTPENRMVGRRSFPLGCLSGRCFVSFWECNFLEGI